MAFIAMLLSGCHLPGHRLLVSLLCHNTPTGISCLVVGDCDEHDCSFVDRKRYAFLCVPAAKLGGGWWLGMEVTGVS